MESRMPNKSLICLYAAVYIALFAAAYLAA